MDKKKFYKRKIPAWLKRKYACSSDGLPDRCYHTLAVEKFSPAVKKLALADDLLTHEIIIGGRDREDVAHVGLFEVPMTGAKPALDGLKPKVKSQEQAEDLVDDIFSAKPRWQFHFPARQSAIVFASLIILIVPIYLGTAIKNLINTRDAVAASGQSALLHLISAQLAIDQLDIIKAEREFAEAAVNFQIGQRYVQELDPVSSEALQWFPQTRNPLNEGLNLLKTGENLSLAAQEIASGVNALLNSQDDVFMGLQAFQEKLVIAQPRIAQAQASLQNLNLEVLPLPNGGNITDLEEQLPKIQKALDYFTLLSDSLLEILGHDQWQRYLLVFTNNNELRGVGGFMGSYALLDVDRGRIKNLEIPPGGTYDSQGNLMVYQASPKPLQLINPRWEFQDANWSPDFPTTAEKIRWFYEQSEGATVDGVIVITSAAVESMLNYIGPVNLAGYNTIVTSENLEEALQQNIRQARDEGSPTPKQILSDLAPLLLDQITQLDKEKMIGFLDLVHEQLKAKQIVINFSDEDLQQLALALDYGGAVKKSEADYLLIVNSNIAGGKTDQVIDRTYNLTTQVGPNGDIVNTLSLTFEHHGIKGTDIFTGVQNNNYLRVYVPLGSTLISASGFERPNSSLFESPPSYYKQDVQLASIEQTAKFDADTKTDIYQDMGKTVFGNWLRVKPGETKTVTLSYRLPFRFGEISSQGKTVHSLLWQKQSGTMADKFSAQLELPKESLILRKYPDHVIRSGNIFGYQDALKEDRFYGIIFDD